jgi:hypothetical protein
MLNGFWQGVKSMLGEPSAPPLALPTCDLAVSDAERVREMLRLLEQGRQVFSLQNQDGMAIGQATIFAVTSSQVTLRCSSRCAGMGAQRVNVAGVSDGGAVLFTVDLVPTRLGDLWRAALPADVLCVQSRQYRRVGVVRSVGHHADLSLPTVAKHWQLLDLSEQGAGLGLQAPLTQEALSEGGLLVLDGMRIRVPRIHLVHVREDKRGTRAGLRLEGVVEHEMRALRRWLNEAESTLITPR